VLLGAVAGAMMVADLGGPLNKTAYAFAVAGITGAGTVRGPAVMAAVLAAGMAAPLGCWLATVLRPGRFTTAERRTGRAAGLLGALFITEGAIPFAAANPLRVLPGLMAGGAVAGATATALGATVTAPHGGVLALFAAGHVLAQLAALVAGSATAAGGVLVARVELPVARRTVKV
jgi:fructose PTS system EIIBC or EIIC component